MEKQEIKSLEKQEMESWEVRRKRWYHGEFSDHQDGMKSWEMISDHWDES